MLNQCKVVFGGDPSRKYGAGDVRDQFVCVCVRCVSIFVFG